MDVDAESIRTRRELSALASREAALEAPRDGGDVAELKAEIAALSARLELMAERLSRLEERPQAGSGKRHRMRGGTSADAARGA